MTLGFNFDMALHLPSSHSSHLSSHHNHNSSSSDGSIGINHSSNNHHQIHNNGSHGYCTYPIKYEPCELQQPQHHNHLITTSSPTTNSSSSSSSSSTAAGAVTGMSGAHDFLLHHHQQQQQNQQISSNSAFERDFFDTLDSSRMNGSNNHQHQQHLHLQQQQQQHNHSHHRMISGGSDPRLSIGSPESDESGEEDDEEALLGLNLIGNSMLSNDKQRQQHLRALGKSSSINSNNSSNSNNLDRKRPYPCKVCPSKFGSKMELEEHQNSHTGQKPFECEVCKSRFNRRSTLWNHKRIHSDAKPFVCTICHMQFKWKNSLKCHKEMHIRKNETPSIGDIDADIRQLTYATAAKRRMLEMDGGDSTRSASSLTIFSAASTSSQSNNNNNNNGGVGSCGSSSSSGGGGNDSTTKNVQRKKQKLTKKDSSNSIKKETMEATTNSSSSLFSASATADAEAAATAAAVAANNDAHQLNLLMNKAFGTSTHGGNDFDNNHTTSNYQGLMSNQAMRKLTFGNLAGDFDNSSNNLMSRDFATDFSLDQSNFDLMNNPLWMHLWNNEQVETMNNFSNPQNNPLFGGMDDPSKVLTGGIFDLKDTLGLQSPNGNNTCNNNNATTNHINMLLPKPMLNIDLNSFNSLQDSVNQQSNLPGINHLTSGTSFPDYSSHDTSSLTSQFHLGQNQSTASSSSTPSSNGHQPNGHLNSELSYHQPLDHALLLNTNHSNDYMLPLEYMTPTGGGGNQQQRQQHSTSLYSSHDLPLSALTSSSSHDPLEHSPHSSSTSRGMFYHSAASNLNDHHPGCISSSQLSTHAAAIAAAQQMR